jgi:hypothetical protein
MTAHGSLDPISKKSINESSKARGGKRGGDRRGKFYFKVLFIGHSSFIQISAVEKKKSV